MDRLHDMIERETDQHRVRHALDLMPVVLLVGPRQCGKTTLARQFVTYGSVNYFDLEDPIDLARLSEPMTALATLSGLIVIDEVQLCAEIFAVLRVLVDRPGNPAQFLVLGSAQPAALRQASESLTGRIAVVELSGLGLGDVGAGQLDQLWLRGGFPRSQTAPSDAIAFELLEFYVRTLVERDLLALDVRLPAAALRRFLSMVAHYDGQVWNSAEPARSLGISEHTVRRYLDLLTDAMLVRQLPAWFANTKKRQVRAPKTYLRDTGLAHLLLGIRSSDELARHPSSGGTWEGFAIDEVVRTLRPSEAYFWGTHNGAELDLFLPTLPVRLGVEIKRSDAPTITKSMHIALKDLELERLVIIYPGTRSYRLDDRVEVIPLATLADPAVARTALLGG
jgi:uncharacterized protein